MERLGNTQQSLHAAVSKAITSAANKKGVKVMKVTRMMFERFTEKAIKVVMLAQEEARRLGHNFVGTEQILLGLIGESTGKHYQKRKQCLSCVLIFRHSPGYGRCYHCLWWSRAEQFSAGIAAKVLKSMGVTLKDARAEVEKIIGRGSGFVAVEIPFTPRAKRVLELSLEEARQLGALSTYIVFEFGNCWFRSTVWWSDPLVAVARPERFWLRFV